jgi:hypothetical protein
VADSVREQILAAFVATLTGLNLGGNPPQVVQKVLRDWNAPEHEGEYPYIVVLDPTEVQQAGGSGGAPLSFYLNRLDVQVWIMVDCGEVRDEPMSQTMNRALAEVQKALYLAAVPGTGAIKSVNGVDWLHATGSQIVAFGESGNVAAVQTTWQVQYIHKATDPFAGRS